VSARRLQLKGASLQELQAQVLAEHGPDAKIVAAEKVTVGGIRGFFAREHYEVTVELPAPPVRGQHALDQKARAGIAALLADAERAESQFNGKVPEVHVSTHTDQFAVVMDNLTFNTARPTRLPKGAKLEEPGTETAAQAPDQPEAGRAPGSAPTGAEMATARRSFGRRRTDSKPKVEAASESGAVIGQEPDVAAGTPAVPAGPPAGPTAAPGVSEAIVVPEAGTATRPADRAAGNAASRPASPRSALADGQQDAVVGTVVVSGVLHAAGTAEPDEAQQPLGQGIAAVPVIPSPLYGPGDLVLVIGQGGNALEAANSMAAAAPAVNGAPSEAADWISSGGNMVRMAGAHAAEVRRPVQDRNSAIGARARGVERGQSVFVAFGLGHSLTPSLEMLAILSALGADQIWLAVDAGRKAEDTDRWVQSVQRVVVPDGLAVTGTRHTSTPKTVNSLGIPVGWIDGVPSEAAWL
jgi:hypothetical protein